MASVSEIKRSFLLATKNRYFAQKSFCFYFLIVRFSPQSEGEIVKHTSFEIKRNTRKFLISMQKKKYRKRYRSKC